MRKKKTHEQFLEDLKLKNKSYRDGKFEVISEYQESRIKILVRNKYGICAITPFSLLNQGSNLHIRSAINPTEYFKNMCYDKFGVNGNDDLSQIEYVNGLTKIKVIDNIYGEYLITPHCYLSGQRGKDAGYAKNRSDKSEIVSKIKELHPDLEILPFNYFNQNNKILVKDKYGVCSVFITSLLLGVRPTIMSSVNKTEYFINKAKEVHGDKYDYSLVEYKSTFYKIKIIGKNGVFLQLPSAHLSGSGCKTEAIDRMGWTHRTWGARAQESKNFTGYKVYFLECWDENEKFYKIGITYRDVSERFKNKRFMPYSYLILHTIEHDDPKYISELEIKLKQHHKDLKYLPCKKFAGRHECFSKLNIDI